MIKEWKIIKTQDLVSIEGPSAGVLTVVVNKELLMDAIKRLDTAAKLLKKDYYDEATSIESFIEDILYPSVKDSESKNE